jgi:hypothetical protein
MVEKRPRYSLQRIPVATEVKAHLELLKGRVPLLKQACAADPEPGGEVGGGGPGKFF